MTGPVPSQQGWPGGYPAAPPGYPTGPGFPAMQPARKPSLVAAIIAFIWLISSAGVEIGFALSEAGGSRKGGFHLGVGHIQNDILAYYIIPPFMVLTVLAGVLVLMRKGWARFVVLGFGLIYAGVHAWRFIEYIPRGMDILELIVRLWFIVFWLIAVLLFFLPPVNRAMDQAQPTYPQFGPPPGFGPPPPGFGGPQQGFPTPSTGFAQPQPFAPPQPGFIPPGQQFPQQPPQGPPQQNPNGGW